LISAGGSALLGCAADPSDLRCRRRQPAAGGLTSTVAVAASLVGIAMAPPWAAAASASSSPAPLTASPPLPRLRPAPSQRRRCRTTAHVRSCRGGGAPPSADARPAHRARARLEGRSQDRAVGRTGRSIAGRRRCRAAASWAPPHRPSLAGYLPCAIGRRPSSPSAASASRRRGCGGGSWPAKRRRAARVSDLLCFFCPVLTRGEETRREEFATAPEIVPGGHPAAAVCFS